MRLSLNMRTFRLIWSSEDRNDNNNKHDDNNNDILGVL